MKKLVYQCDKCGCIFDELRRITDNSEFWVSPCCRTSFEELREEEVTYTAEDDADFRYHEMRDMECIEYAF